MALKCESVTLAGKMCPKQKDIGVFFSQFGIEFSKDSLGYEEPALDQCPATYKGATLFHLRPTQFAKPSCDPHKRPCNYRFATESQWYIIGMQQCTFYKYMPCG